MTVAGEGARDFRHAIELLAAAATASLLTFICIVYVARLAGPTQYADFSAGLAFIYFAMYAVSTLVPTVARVSSRLMADEGVGAVGALRGRLFRIGWVVVPAIIIAGSLIAIPAAHALRFQSPAPLVLAIVTVAVSVFLSIDRGVAQGLFLVRHYNWNMFAESAVRAVLLFALLRTFPTAAFAMAAWVAAAVVAQLLIANTMLRLPVSDGLPSLQPFAEILRPMTVILLAVAVFQNTDILAIKRWFPASVAGTYGAAYAIARGFGVVFVPLFALAGPVLTRDHAAGRNVGRATLQLTGGYVVLTVLPLIAIGLWPDAVVGLLYGASYREAADLLLPIGGVTIVTYAGLMLAQALITLNDFRFVTPYVALALAQVVALMFFHGTVHEVLGVLYIVQGGALVTISVYFIVAIFRWQKPA